MHRGLNPDDLELVLGSIRDFAAENLPDPVLLELDRADRFPEDIVRAFCADLGISLVFVDEPYGGMGGGAFDVYRVCEAMGAIDLGVATGVLATFLGSDPIAFGGTEEQKQRWLGRVAEEGILMAYGATEPQAGSDLAALLTTAKPVEEDGKTIGYVLNGSKQWISNGAVADLTTILALAPGGPTWFVVPREAEGFSAGKPEEKHGIRASNTAPLMLDGVRVGVDDLVGGVEGQGLRQAQLVFGFTRLMVAAFGLGAGWAALDRAIPYSLDRVQAGAPLAEKQGYTHKLIVPHVVRLEASRAYIEETASRLDQGEGALNTEGAIAKYLATEFGNLAADAAIQALGGYGYTHEYMVEKIRRDVRITTIYEGTSEIMEMTVFRGAWGQHLRTRGQHYRDVADELDALDPAIGASTVALAMRSLAAVLEQARVSRLTREQHIQFRLGELIAWAEGAAAMARRAARAARGGLPKKADRRFDADALAAISRCFAREAALKVAADGMRWVGGSISAGDAARLGEASRLPAIYAAQAGQLQDMNHLADVLYGRA